jgi:capping protein alpha
LISNDQLIQERLYNSFAKYNKEQLFPVRSVADNNVPTLVSEWGELPSSLGLGPNVYYSPRLKKSFRFEHLRRESSDWKPLPQSPELLSALGINERAERLRGALEAAAIDYVTLHYCKQGSVEVFARSPQLPPVNHEAAGGASVAFAICIENHLFQQKNFWNGSWRSLWVLYATPDAGAGASVRLEGRMRVQVHYYEEGNVQLYTPKECSLNLTYHSDDKTFAASVIKAIMKEESAYQSALNETYQAMNDTTFKALRRVLPITRTKVDWAKIVTYRIGAELRGANPAGSS